MKHQVLFSLKNNEKIVMNVVCCSHDWRFKALPLSWYAFYFQAVFDETLHKLVDTYLRYAPRRYDIIKELPEEAKERHDEIHQLIFMTCLRMATFKESKVLFNQGPDTVGGHKYFITVQIPFDFSAFFSVQEN